MFKLLGNPLREKNKNKKDDEIVVHTAWRSIRAEAYLNLKMINKVSLLVVAIGDRGLSRQLCIMQVIVKYERKFNGCPKHIRK